MSCRLFDKITIRHTITYTDRARSGKYKRYDRTSQSNYNNFSLIINATNWWP